MVTEPEDWQPPVPTGRSFAPIEGFPSWMRQPLILWLQMRFPSNREWVITDHLVNFQIEMQRDFGFVPGETRWNEVSRWLLEISDAEFLLFLDFLLWKSSQERSPAHINAHVVEDILSRSGSRWSAVRVGKRVRLTERVSQGVAGSVAQALTGSDASARKLQEAWVDAFGIKVRPSVAYYNAVVAVENAAFAIVPLEGEPTLSSLFSVLHADTPKWRLILRDSDNAPGAKVLEKMLRALWRGHDSRHGASDYEDVTLEQARAAVMLAATLVWWFQNGVVIPVS